MHCLNILKECVFVNPDDLLNSCKVNLQQKVFTAIDLVKFGFKISDYNV